jgi:hypothetical protein
MPHEGAAPGSPGAPHIPPYQPGPPPPADPEWPEGGPPGGGDQGGISRPDTGYIPFDPSERTMPPRRLQNS